MPASPALITAARRLSRALAPLRFAAPVTHVYNPLAYAWPLHRAYLERFAGAGKRVVFLGMNPGPYGMAQTGVPFGEIAAVRDWMGLSGAVGAPDPVHPKRPILGLACARSEVSGRRLWGLFRSRFGSPERFFARHFVANYCPLVFMEGSGRNRTPNQLPKDEAAAVAAACDRHLLELVAVLAPEIVVGIGNYAAGCAGRVLAGQAVRIATIPHPSPANPSANKDWNGMTERALIRQGVWAARAT
jgi:single-strand selective monofunctional uracil DNA glycosylase